MAVDEMQLKMLEEQLRAMPLKDLLSLRDVDAATGPLAGMVGGSDIPPLNMFQKAGMAIKEDLGKAGQEIQGFRDKAGDVMGRFYGGKIAPALQTMGDIAAGTPNLAPAAYDLLEAGGPVEKALEKPVSVNPFHVAGAFGYPGAMAPTPEAMGQMAAYQPKPSEPLASKMFKVTQPVVQAAGTLGGGWMDYLSLLADAAKAIPSTAGYVEPGFEGRQKKGKFLSNVRQEQQIREGGGRGQIYEEALRKKWTPKYIAAKIRAGQSSADVADEMQNEMNMMGIAGDVSDFLSDFLAFEGVQRLPQAFDKGAAAAKAWYNRRVLYKSKLAKRRQTLADREMKLQAYAASDEGRYQKWLKDKYEALPEKGQLDVALRKETTRTGPLTPDDEFKMYKEGLVKQEKAGMRKERARIKRQKKIDKEIFDEEQMAARAAEELRLREKEWMQMRKEGRVSEAEAAEAAFYEQRAVDYMRPENVARRQRIAAEMKKKAQRAAEHEAMLKQQAKPQPRSQEPAPAKPEAKKEAPSIFKKKDKPVAKPAAAEAEAPTPPAQPTPAAQPPKVDLGKLTDAQLKQRAKNLRATGRATEAGAVEAELARRGAAQPAPADQPKPSKPKPASEKIPEKPTVSGSGTVDNGVDLTKLTTAQLKERAKNLKATGQASRAAKVEAELAKRVGQELQKPAPSKPKGNKVKQGGKKVSKKPQEPSKGETVDDIWEFDDVAPLPMTDDELGAAIKNAVFGKGGEKKTSLKSKGGFLRYERVKKKGVTEQEWINWNKLLSTMDTSEGAPSVRKQLMDKFKWSADEADQIINRFTSTSPAAKPRFGRPFLNPREELTLTKTERAVEGVKNLAEVTVTGADDAEAIASALDKATTAMAISSRGIKRTSAKELISGLSAQGVPKNEAITALTKLNSQMEAVSQTTGKVTEGDKLVKQALKILTGKNVPPTKISVPASETKKASSPFFKKTDMTTAEKIAAGEAPNVEVKPSKGGAAVTRPDMPVAKPSPRPRPGYEFGNFRQTLEKRKSLVDKMANATTTKEKAALSSEIEKVNRSLTKQAIEDKQSRMEYFKWKREVIKERQKVVAEASKKIKARDAKYEKDTEFMRKAAKADARYDRGVSQFKAEEKAAYEAEMNYHIEEELKVNIRTELEALRQQLKKVNRKGGRGIALKRKSIEERISKLVAEREQLSGNQAERLKKLAKYNIDKEEIRYQSNLQRQVELEKRLRATTDKATRNDIKLQLAGLKVEADLRVYNLSRSKEIMDEVSKMSGGELLKEIGVRSPREYLEGEEAFWRIGKKALDAAEEIKKANLLKKAKAKAVEYQLYELMNDISARAKRAGVAVSQILDDMKTPEGKPLYNIVEKKDLIRRIADHEKLLAKESRIGNIHLNRYAKRGDLEPEVLEMFREVYRENPKLFDKRKVVGTAAQRRAILDMITRKVGKKLFNLTDSQMAGVHSMPMADAIMMANRAIEGRIPPQIAKESIRSFLINYDRAGAGVARALNARKGVFAPDDLLRDLRLRMKGASTKEVEEAYMEMINLFAKYRRDPTAFQQAYDLFHEYSVTNILGAGITSARNLVGATAEVYINQPRDVIFRALVSKLFGHIPGVDVNDYTYIREIVPQINALYYNIPEGIETGTRFLVRGTTRGVLNSMREEIMFLLNIKGKTNSRMVDNIIKRRIARVMRHRASLLDIKAGVRTGEVFTGKEGSKIIELGKDIAESDKIFNKAMGGAVQAYGYYKNIPLRMLVGADAALTHTSYQGHVASLRARNWVRTMKDNKGSKIIKKIIDERKYGVTRKRKIYQLIDAEGYNRYKKGLGFADKHIIIKDIAKAPLTEAQHAQALDDALYYMYRRPFQSKLGTNLEKVFRSRGFNQLFLFMKTRTNIQKLAIDSSPLGLVTSFVPESIKATKALPKGSNKVISLDAKSLARVIRGTLTIAWLDWMAEKAGGRWVGPPDNARDRKTRQAMGLPQFYYEDVAGQPDKGIRPLANMAPMSGKFAQITAYNKFKEEMRRGKGFGKSAKTAFFQLLRSIGEDTMYSDIKATTRFIESLNADPEDPESGFSEKLSRMVGKTVSSRLVDNKYREIKQSGTLYGIKIPGYEKDPTVAQPSTGTFIGNVAQSVWFDAMVFGKQPGVARKPSVFTGAPVERFPRYAPNFLNLLSYVHPKFFPKGYKPTDHLNPDEYEAAKLLNDYDVALPEPPASLSVAGGALKLTAKEQNDYVQTMAHENKTVLWNTMMNAMSTAKNKMAMYEAMGVPFPERREKLKGIIADVRKKVNKEYKKIIIKRMMGTKQGRITMHEKIFKKKEEYTDSPEDREKLIRVLIKNDPRILTTIQELINEGLL